MIKEFKIIEILNAVDNIYTVNKEKSRIPEKKDYRLNNDALSLNKHAESNKSEILVLNQMIEQNIKTFNEKKLDDYTVRKLF